MKRRIFICMVLIGLGVFVLPAKVLAGGAMMTDLEGEPMHWGLDRPLVYNPEHAPLKQGHPSFGTEASLALIDDAFDTWTTLPDVLLTVERGTFLNGGAEVDVNNYFNFLESAFIDCPRADPSQSCVSPIIFDEDGEILDTIFGRCAKFSSLGFASIDLIQGPSGGLVSTNIQRAEAVFSGACISPVEFKDGCGVCPRALSEDDVRRTILHELGHFLGMGHNQVNPNSFRACVDRGGCTSALADEIPVMFPVVVSGVREASLHTDDIRYFQRLYADNEGDFCSVSGSVLASDGLTGVRGVEVVARNTNPYLSKLDAIAFVSGAEAPRYNYTSREQSNCRSHCGDYKITGLNPGQSYQLCAQRILDRFTGGAAIEPVDPPFQGISNYCPEGLIVTCECHAGGCKNFEDKNFVTSLDPNVILDQIHPNADSSLYDGAGGCSLMPQARRVTGVWWILVSFSMSHS